MKFKYLICIIAFLFLTACGGTVRTDMSFNDSFSGSRIMTYTVANQDFTSYVSGDLNTIQSTLSSLCPEEIEITSVKQDDSNITAVLTLNFDSLEDYKKKVNNILEKEGIDTVPEVVFLKPDSVFARGVAYQENFSTKDLLNWMYNGIVDNNYVTSSYISYIFAAGYSSVTFNGTKYEADGYMDIIDVNSVEYLRINGVNFSTVINKNGTLDRTITVSIPDSTYKEAENDIKRFLKERGEGASDSEWSEDNGDHIFTMIGRDMSPKECMEMTDLFTGTPGDRSLAFSENKKIKGDSQEKTEEERRKLFYKDYSLKESINLYDYISNSDNAVNFSYKMNSENSYSGNVTDAEGYQRQIETRSQNDEEEIEVFSGYSYSFDVNLDVTVSPKVAKYKHVVNITPTGNIKRNITVVYNNSFNADEASTLEAKLRDAYADTNIKLDKISLNGENPEIKISSNANMEDDIRMWEEVSGYTRSYSSLGMDKKGFMPRRQIIYFNEYFNPEIFTSTSIDSYEYIVKNIGKPVSDEYYENLNAGSFINGASGDFKGNDFIVKGENVSVYDYDGVMLATVRTNNSAYLIYVLFVLTILFLLFRIIVTFAPGLTINKVQNRDINPAANTASQAEAVFCPHCGAKNGKNDKFCLSCGKEIM